MLYTEELLPAFDMSDMLYLFPENSKVIFGKIFRATISTTIHINAVRKGAKRYTIPFSIPVFPGIILWSIRVIKTKGIPIRGKPTP